ncbi:MAG TPA: hypothetical protein VGB83_10695 [Actinomycetota bacterium]
MKNKVIAIAAATGALSSMLVMQLMGTSATAAGEPANKTAVSGSTIASMSAPVNDGATSEEVTLFTATMKTSAPTDLIFQVEAECSLITNVVDLKTDDDDNAPGDFTDTSHADGAVAQMQVWIEDENGNPVGVASGDDGRVVFCNRAFHQDITDLTQYNPDSGENEPSDANFDTYLETRSTHGFNWIRVNAGSGVHTYTVKALLEATATAQGYAQAIVGKRTLVIEPVKLAQRASI